MNVSTVAVAAAIAGAGAQVVADTLHIPPPSWHGLPVDVLLWACAGALASLAFTKPEAWSDFEHAASWKMKLLAACEVAFTLAVNAFVTTLAVIALPHIPVVGPYIDKVPSMALAGLGAAFFQPLLRGGSAALGRWVRSKTPERPEGGA